MGLSEILGIVTVILLLVTIILQILGRKNPILAK